MKSSPELKQANHILYIHHIHHHIVGVHFSYYRYASKSAFVTELDCKHNHSSTSNSLIIEYTPTKDRRYEVKVRIIGSINA